jgi:hypothetical protein
LRCGRHATLCKNGPGESRFKRFAYIFLSVGFCIVGTA